jgi:hypothetical protein
MTGGWLSARLNRASVLPATSEPDRRFVGGMRVGGGLRWSFNATWPLAVLELHDDGLRLVTRGRLMRSIAPVWEANYKELTEVRAVGKIPLFTTGVRLRVATGENSWAIFWCLRRERVLLALRERGLDVQADPDRLNALDPGRTPRHG